MEHDCDRRHGAKQPEIFSHERAARLDDPQRESFLPTPVLIAALDAPHGANVLDFGAGTGRYAIALARARPDLHVVAFDVQPEMTAIVGRRAAEAGLSNIETVETDVARLPRASFARILAVNVLHEIGDIDVRALGDLLGPGGYALLVDWDGGVPREVGPPADHVHTLAEARERLLRCGLSAQSLGIAEFPNHYVLRVTCRLRKDPLRIGPECFVETRSDEGTTP